MLSLWEAPFAWDVAEDMGGEKEPLVCARAIRVGGMAGGGNVGGRVLKTQRDN